MGIPETLVSLAVPIDSVKPYDGNPRPLTVLAALEAYLSPLELDALGETQAALARSLAIKLTQALRLDSAQAAMALPGLARELREVLDQIQGASDDNQDFVSGLFAASTS